MSTRAGDTILENKVKKQKLAGEEMQVQIGSITTYFKPTDKLKVKQQIKSQIKSILKSSKTKEVDLTKAVLSNDTKTYFCLVLELPPKRLYI